MKFDFDDIVAKTEEKKKKLDKNENSVANLGFNIAIPRSKGFLFKDMGECTAEEFIEWILAVYPLIDEKQLNPNDFTKPQQRIRVFKEVERFHREKLFERKNITNKISH